MKNNKSLGQHWLKDRQILDDIASLAETKDVKFCLEIGPGLGTLTSSLFKHFSDIVAIELDENLAKNLPKSFPGKNLTVENIDFLKFDLEKINRPYVVTGNIPYYVTSPIIQKIINTNNQPNKIVLLIQKEVAERIASVRSQNMLSLTVQNKAKVQLGPVVSREYFTPPPKVDSQIIVLAPREEPIIAESVFGLIKIGFTSPRKKLIANLSVGLKISKELLRGYLSKNNLNPDCRPSELNLIDWQNLKNTIDNV